jgi:DNA-binding response OmpR family regulator
VGDVLIVEEEESLLQALRHNLSRAGHDVRLRTDGRLALEMVLDHPPGGRG